MTRRPLAQLATRVAPATLSRVSTAAMPRSEDAQDRKRFYDSAVWQRTREAKLRRDPLCQCCAYVRITTVAIEVDHWTPLAAGGHATADENLVSLCTPCHSRKTQAERLGQPYPDIVPSKPRQLVIA